MAFLTRIRNCSSNHCPACSAPGVAVMRPTVTRNRRHRRTAQENLRGEPSPPEHTHRLAESGPSAPGAISLFIVRIRWATVALLVVASAARAEPPRLVDLVWEAPGSCPRGAAVSAEIVRLVPPKQGRPTLRATAYVRRLGERWSVTLTTEHGERHLEAESCAALGDAVALILALAIDPTTKPLARPLIARAPLAPTTATTPAVTSTAAFVSVPAPIPVSATSTESRPPLSRSSLRRLPRLPPAAEERTDVTPRDPRDAPLELGAALAADFGELPGPAAGLEAFVAGRLRPLRAELFGHYWFSRRAAVAGTDPPIGGDVAAYDVGLRAGLGLRRDRLELAPRVGVEVMHMTAEAFGATSSSHGSESWIGLSAGIGAHVDLAPRVALHVAADAAVPLARPEFVVLNVGSVHRPAQIAGRGVLGVVARFF